MNHSERAEESLSSNSRPEELGDFTATWRLIPISAAAMVIGVIASYVALALLKLIGLFTNLFYHQRWSTALVSPAGNTKREISPRLPCGNLGVCQWRH